jgi:adenylosuccinate lyase
LGLLSEGFQEEQVGSSAMPHKMNARNCERINGFQAILAGYMEMAARLAGDQWLEGDVSCSVVRRVALPDALFALDGALETALTVLDELEVFPQAIAAEVSRELPFLATTTLLMEAVRRGGARERLHGIVREHSLAVMRGLRDGTLQKNDLPERLGADPEFPLSVEEIHALLGDAGRYAGAAPQADAFVAQVAEIARRFPRAAAYQPQPLI